MQSLNFSYVVHGMKHRREKEEKMGIMMKRHVGMPSKRSSLSSFFLGLKCFWNFISYGSSKSVENKRKERGENSEVFVCNNKIIYTKQEERSQLVKECGAKRRMFFK